jgi:hypothetical protein
LLVAHAAQSSTVGIQENVIIEIAGATAAYTTNPAIADAVIAGTGRISVTGHSAGSTQMMVITPFGTQSFLITVAPSANRSADRPRVGEPQARYDGRYSSASGRIQNTVDVVTNSETRRSEFHVLHIHDLPPHRRADSIASIFYRDTTPGRVLTLLDDMVDLSRTTISNTQLRGVHQRRGPLEIHGGYASSTMYDSFFLPAERRWTAGAGYDIDRGSTRWTPSVYGFFSQPAGTAARRGLVAAVTAEHRRGDTLFLRGDVGVSRSIAASGEVRYASPRSRFRAFFSFKPDDYPTLGLADVRGQHLEADGSHRATDRLSITSNGTFDRFDLAALPQTIGVASVGLRYALNDRVALVGGLDGSSIETPSASIRTLGVPLGVSYDTPGFGLAAAYRLLHNSAASRRGDALRLNVHAGRGRFNANAWAERQRQAPTLDLIFSAEPGLELALLRLGISARNPDDVARALRDNAALIDLGFITGVNVDLTPRRIQAGLNLGWLGSGQRSDHLRLFAVYSRDEGIRATRESEIATLTYSRRIWSATDLYGAYSWYRTAVDGRQDSGTSIDLGVRQQFNGLPMFLRRSGTIEGYVFLDPEMRGVRDANTGALPDITITLDGTRTARTDHKGAYAFDKVSPGAHRVAAQLPASPRAFFTTPSHAETNGPAQIDFGLVWAAARIDGQAVSDAGDGIAGLVVSAAAGNAAPITTTTDADGRFVFAVPPGTFRVALAASSLPPGYSMTGQQEKLVTVEPDLPQSTSFEVQAFRSIAGRATGASEVRIESLDRTARVDSAGNFVFRSMPAGTFTITAGSGGRLLRTEVTLPAEPSMIRDVVLGTRSAQTAPPVAMRSPVSTGAHVIQTGAFRHQRNAVELLERLRRRGEKPFTVLTRGLTFVYIGPFETRDDAHVAVARLKEAGFDGYVTPR